MISADASNGEIVMPGIPGFRFRPFQDDTDYNHMLTIISESDRADQVSGTLTLEDVISWCAPTKRFDPTRNLFFALKDEAAGETAVGFSRARWYTGLDGIRLYSTSSYMHPAWRDRRLWSVLVRLSEQRLREIAASHPRERGRSYQSWATATQVEWIAVLEGEGYLAVRHFNNMLYHLDEIVEKELPPGLEIRPVQLDHMRSIWETQREVVLGLFEVVAENWTDDDFETWRKDPSHTPQLWQVAWDGDQVAGMVLNRISEQENQQLGRKRGYTEHVFVRQAWRKRGLASALLSRSLQVLRDQGMEEAELGVDTENESGAYQLYQRMGYKTFSTDIWFRKPME